MYSDMSHLFFILKLCLNWENQRTIVMKKVGTHDHSLIKVSPRLLISCFSWLHLSNVYELDWDRKLSLDRENWKCLGLFHLQLFQLQVSETEVFIADYEFKFYSKPYYLRSVLFSRLSSTFDDIFFTVAYPLTFIFLLISYKLLVSFLVSNSNYPYISE